jgi:predicted nucleic acid-binding protein
MPAGASSPELLVDTSVAIALIAADHVRHKETLRAVGDRRLGLAGHAAFETYSVLTRLPAPARRRPQTVARLLFANFPHTRFLGAKAAAALLDELHAAGVAGGAVYDALVGATAREHGVILATRDQRAVETYRSLEVRVEVLS